jgi:hypothetical protein
LAGRGPDLRGNKLAADTLAERIRPTGTPFLAMSAGATDADVMHAVRGGSP